jgi:hypothetical protein
MVQPLSPTGGALQMEPHGGGPRGSDRFAGAHAMAHLTAGRPVAVPVSLGLGSTRRVPRFAANLNSREPPKGLGRQDTPGTRRLDGDKRFR